MRVVALRGRYSLMGVLAVLVRGGGSISTGTGAEEGESDEDDDDSGAAGGDGETEGRAPCPTNCLSSQGKGVCNCMHK